jgi:hypothetical protein
MLLAVAGLDQEQLFARTRRLATGDWSSFPPAERAAYLFARKQARTLWEIDDADVRQLIEQFGAERALDVIWWSCRCHFMTRVADGFQLPLERDNVFQSPPAKPARTNDEPKADTKLGRTRNSRQIAVLLRSSVFRSLSHETHSSDLRSVCCNSMRLFVFFGPGRRQS